MSHEQMQKSRQPRVLIAEDDATHAEIAIEVFTEPLPWETVWIEDGAAALWYLLRLGKYAAAPRPDLVILNIVMPRRSGLEVLAQAKADPRLASIPMVIWSVGTSQEEVGFAYEHGAAGYFAKPVRGEDMRHQMRIVRRYWESVMLHEWP